MMTPITQASFPANGAMIRLVDDPLLFVPGDSQTPLSYLLNPFGVGEPPRMSPPSVGPAMAGAAGAFPPFVLSGWPAGQGGSPSAPGSGPGQALPGYRLDHMGVAERLFIGAVMNSPQRPWGIVTQMAQEFRTSRPTLYAIGQRTYQIMLPLPSGRPAVEGLGSRLSPPMVAVTPTRIERTILTLLLPGGMTTRPMQDGLQEAFGQSRSVGFISELIQQAGQRARKTLEGVDYSLMGPVVLARDEAFFPLPMMLLVEPLSSAIVTFHLDQECDALTWGALLLEACQDKKVDLIGLVEDAAKPYPTSLQQADLSLPVQKDVWHVLDKASQTLTDVERAALKALEKVYTLEKKLSKAFNDQTFEEYVAATDQADHLLEESSQLRFWVGCLADALELVDWRSGEVRDRQINQWLLEETLAGLKKLTHPKIKALVTYLENQKPHLLTFLDWLEVQMVAWRIALAQYLPEGQQQAFFESTVARAWRLEQAVTNGHKGFRRAATEARELVKELVAGDPRAEQLAHGLTHILDGVIRTSCAAENINSILKPYLWVKKSFQNPETAQNFLYLFILWHNMRSYKRGERRGKSPFELAGIKVYTPDGRETADWLEALGYPAEA